MFLIEINIKMIDIRLISKISQIYKMNKVTKINHMMNLINFSNNNIKINNFRGF